ncbi:MAG: hypothetical protein WHV44_13185 [Anaerolineales bacterium]
MGPVARSKKAAAWMAALIGLLLAGGQAACQPTPTPEVTVEFLLPLTQPLPLDCIETDNVSLEVQTSPQGEVRLTVSGLAPSETVTLVLYAETEGRTFQIETSPVASAEGRIEYVEKLGAVGGGFFKNWRVKVRHAGGVACAAITLP